jgi:hypothetical protein
MAALKAVKIGMLPVGATRAVAVLVVWHPSRESRRLQGPA